MPLKEFVAKHPDTNKDIKIAIEPSLIDGVEEYDMGNDEEWCFISSSQAGWQYLIKAKFSMIKYLADGFNVEIFHTN